MSQRATELRQTQAALAAFSLRYRTEVGQLHEALDDLQRAIAEAELDQKVDRPDGG